MSGLSVASFDRDAALLYSVSVVVSVKYPVVKGCVLLTFSEIILQPSTDHFLFVLT